MRRLVLITGAVVVGGVVAAGYAGLGGDDEPVPSAPSESTIVFAVGDGASPQGPAQELAAYVREQPMDRFFYLGDVYEKGTAREFREHYEPLYGALADRTDPVIGNHESLRRALGYYPYWRQKRGWDRRRALRRAYVDRSGWQVIAYSSESPARLEARWVRLRFARHSGTCRIALAHRGRHDVARRGRAGNPGQEPIWRALAGRTAINLVGHNHLYGRLAPIDGIHAIASGAGGHEFHPQGKQRERVAAVKTGVATATRLVLRRGAADVQQVDANGNVYDRTTITCTPAEGG